MAVCLHDIVKFLILIFLVFIFVVSGQLENDSCVTPDGVISKCIIVSSCKHIDDVFHLAASGGLNSSIIALLRSYSCGFDSNNKPKVCCPLTPIIESKVITSTPPPSRGAVQTEEKKCDSIKCIRITACKPIMGLLNLSITPKLKSLLTASHCGWYSSKEPKVCCPETLPQPPVVTNHRNINLLPIECGLLGSSNRVFNGNKTGLFEFPWMALLSYKTVSGPRFNCGGTILNSRYILTAAHCITNLNTPLIGVRVGEHDIRTTIDCEKNEDDEDICAPPFQDLTIEEVIPYPEYNIKTHSNDIGLLRVTKMDLELEHIKPVCLPLRNTRNFNYTGRYGLVTGWGATETGRSSPDLLKVSLPVIEQTECVKTYAKVVNITITHRQLCAGGKTQSDSCAGDSGGPLYVIATLHDDTRMVQQGIVSFGPRACGGQKLPGVYTRVAYYMDWILDNLKL